MMILDDCMATVQAAVELNEHQLTLWRQVRDWRDRHGEHAGNAPLSELDAILARVFKEGGRG